MISRLRPRADEGAALLVALLFVMVVGIALAAMLPYTQAGISEAGTARDVRSVQNAADGAVQGAIGQARSTLGTCNPSYTAPSYPNPITGGAPVAVTVTCAAASGGGGGNPDVPPFAIVTTGGDITETGKVLSVDGGIYSSGAIATPGGGGGGSVVVAGDAYSATSNCGRVFASGAQCPATGIPSLPSVNYLSSLGADAAAAGTNIGAMTADPLGTCTSSTSIVTFVPGYYSQIPTVDPTTCAGSSARTWWFSPCTPYPACVTSATGPGTYYFDFPDASYDNYNNDGSGTKNGTGALWNLDKGTGVDVVGGTLANGWDATTNDAIVQAAAAGSRCNSKKTGVQFALGGPTQIKTGNSSEIELCGSVTSTTSGNSTAAQRLVLYGLSSAPNFGLQSPTGPRTKITPEPDVSASTTADVTGDSNFTNRGGARTANDGLNYASGAFVSGGGGATYGVELSGYAQVPGGSLISHAFIEVTHAETSNSINPSLKITYKDGSTDTCTVPKNNIGSSPITQAVFTTANIDLVQDCGADTLAGAAYRWKQLGTGFKVVYEAQAGNSVTGTELVDGVQLRTVAFAPALEAGRCTSGAAGSCVPLAYTNSGSSATNNTYFIGSVYTPSAGLNVVVHNSPNTIFQRGVIVDNLTVDANASSTQTDPPFQLPHSAAITRDFLFAATTGGRVRLRALVHVVDCMPAPACETSPNDPGNIVWPGREVDIREWTTLP